MTAHLKLSFRHRYTDDYFDPCDRFIACLIFEGVSYKLSFRVRRRIAPGTTIGTPGAICHHNM